MSETVRVVEVDSPTEARVSVCLQNSKKDTGGRWYSVLTGTCSGPASTKPMNLGSMIASGRLYESTSSEFDTPDVPVEKYEHQAELEVDEDPDEAKKKENYTKRVGTGFAE